VTNSREKGKRFEREAAKLFSGITGVPWRRTQQHKSGGIVGDIEPAVPDTDWARLHVEVKSVEAMKIGTELLAKACVQAIWDCPVGHRWVVLYRERRGVWVLVVPQPTSSGVYVHAHYTGEDIGRVLPDIKHAITASRDVEVLEVLDG